VRDPAAEQFGGRLWVCGWVERGWGGVGGGLPFCPTTWQILTHRRRVYCYNCNANWTRHIMKIKNFIFFVMKKY